MKLWVSSSLGTTNDRYDARSLLVVMNIVYDRNLSLVRIDSLKAPLCRPPYYLFFRASGVPMRHSEI
jgi:hypothetical protein